MAHARTKTTLKMPGGEIASRELRFYLLADCSGSMAIDGKDESLNYAVRMALPGMLDAARKNPEVRVKIRTMCFAEEAVWVNDASVPVESFQWKHLKAIGDASTKMGQALGLLAEEPKGATNEVPPVILLVSDGRPTDDFQSGLASLLSKQWGQRAIRVAIAIGKGADEDVLGRFVADSGKVLRAENADQLRDYIEWATTTLVLAASTRAPGGQEESNGPGVVVNYPGDENYGDGDWKKH